MENTMQNDTEFAQWATDFLEQLAIAEDEFAPGMLEAYPELWVNPNTLVGDDSEEDTLA